MPKLMLSVVLFLCASSVCAQVYKCPGADGSVEFSDQPCGGNAELVNDIDPGSYGDGGGGSGSSLTLANGNVQPFKKVVSIEVRTKTGVKTGTEGMHVYYDRTDHMVEFENLVAMTIIDWGRKSCGNAAHLCEPDVIIQTKEGKISTRYVALNNIKILTHDSQDGAEKEMTIWFGEQNRPNILTITF